ncbi:MAG: hypothetical protein KDD84_01125 [Caldilineaceae bacterium]|nr:hypothetical protein [Caldilineaceae bacterium]
MKFLRTVALLSAALTVVLSQFLLSSVESINSLPARLYELLPGLRSLTLWSAGDLQGLALLLVTAGALVFGLVAQPWEPSQFVERQRITPRRGRLGAVLVGAALVLGVAVFLFCWREASEPIWLLTAWAASIVLVLAGAGLMTVQPGATDDSPPTAHPEAGWPLLLLVLVGVGLLTSWQLGDLPMHVTDAAVVHGLQSKVLLTGAESRVFAPGWDNLPLFAFYPAALAAFPNGDIFLGSRLAGMAAGLLTVFGVWLLGCELFRRPPVRVDGYRLRDDGRSAALIAAIVTGLGYTFVHFSRQPLFLEPVAWGTLSLWALHRGLRSGSRLSLALSGLLLGVTALLYVSGWIFVAVALVWWIWIALGRGHWLHGDHGVGRRGLGVWAAGGLVFAAPVIGVWLRLPDLFEQRFLSATVFEAAALARMEAFFGVQGLPAVLWESFRRSLLTINYYADTSVVFGFDGPMFDPFVGALLIMGAGVIILNLDRLLSWLLLTWLGLTLLLGGALTEGAPFWPYLLPLLPVSGLIAGLAVERWRATLLLTGGPWLRHVGTVAALGLLLWSGARNWVTYYEHYSLLDQPAAEASVIHIGRALRTLSPGQTPYLVVGDGRPAWDDPRIEYLAGAVYDALPHGELQLESLPDALPAGGVILLLPEDQVLSSVLASHFPDGVYRILRDRQSNPITVIYGDWGLGTRD